MVRRVLPPLCRSVSAAHTRRGAQSEPYDQTPWRRSYQVGIDHPSKTASDDERSQQFRSDTNGLAEPRIERIL